jgi:hypothetical protein
VNARFKHSVAQFVWLVPTVVLVYKFMTFPSPSVLQNQFHLAFHQYFGDGFLIPEFRNWHDFWTVVRTNPDMIREKTQLDFTAPFYAGIGYSLAAWIGHRTNLSQKVSEGVKNWENSRSESRQNKFEVGHPCERLSPIGTGCANERPSGSGEGAACDGCPNHAGQLAFTLAKDGHRLSIGAEFCLQ